MTLKEFIVAFTKIGGVIEYSKQHTRGNPEPQLAMKITFPAMDETNTPPEPHEQTYAIRHDIDAVREDALTQIACAMLQRHGITLSA